MGKAEGKKYRKIRREAEERLTLASTRFNRTA
jgi:hypothetical protein